MNIDQLIDKAKTSACHHPQHEKLLFDLAGVVEHLRKVIGYGQSYSCVLESEEGFIALPVATWRSICNAAELETR